MKNNVIERCSGLGLTDGGGNTIFSSHSNLIDGNIITDCGGIGLAVWNAGDDVVSNNKISGWGVAGYAFGIYIIAYQGANSPRTLITGNTLTHTNPALVAQPICLEGPSDCTISNNVITVSNAQGIRISSFPIADGESADNNLIQGNTIQAKWGIYIADAPCTGNRISGNNLSNCQTPIADYGTGTIIS